MAETVAVAETVDMDRWVEEVAVEEVEDVAVVVEEEVSVREEVVEEVVTEGVVEVDSVIEAGLLLETKEASEGKEDMVAIKVRKVDTVTANLVTAIREVTAVEIREDSARAVINKLWEERHHRSKVE